MQYYKKVLFQIKYEETYYLGIFTYDFFRYSYFEYLENQRIYRENLKPVLKKGLKQKKVYNEMMTQYIQCFLDLCIKTKEYDIYFIAEICNQEKSDIEFDERIHVQCVLNQSERRFQFLDIEWKEEEYQMIEESVYAINNIWNFKDYQDEEKPFLFMDENIEESDETESDLDSEDEYCKECERCERYERYEKMDECYSVEFREKYIKDARDKRSFWSHVLYKIKNSKNRELRDYCRCREATQICRFFFYEEDHLFRIRHLFIVKNVYIRNEEYINKDFDNNDELSVSIQFTLQSKCGKYETIGYICRSGCYENGGFSDECEIDKIENVNSKTLEKLFKDLFRNYCPLDI